MTKNIGTIDRIIRTVLAIAVGVLYLGDFISGIAAIILGIFAVILLVTSFIRYCPLYVPLKINTIGKKN
jgi:hypothetical protein